MWLRLTWKQRIISDKIVLLCGKVKDNRSTCTCSCWSVQEFNYNPNNASTFMVCNINFLSHFFILILQNAVCSSKSNMIFIILNKEGQKTELKADLVFYCSEFFRSVYCKGFFVLFSKCQLGNNGLLIFILEIILWCCRCF